MAVTTEKRALIAGGGGFIGGHLARALLGRGYKVRVVDAKPLGAWYQLHPLADNRVLDLRDPGACQASVSGCDEVYNLACNMGGIGFLARHRVDCMLSVVVNTQLLQAAETQGVHRYFFASSACVYPTHLQEDAAVTALKESDAYPALPEDGYGWEKLFSERLCLHYRLERGLETRVFRFHNVYGPYGTWDGGREKAPAAICRKVLEAKRNGSNEIELWGDGEQTRSFMYIDDCVRGIEKLVASDYGEPLNLGRSELVTVNQLVDLVQGVAGVTLKRRYVQDAPQGVRGRNSDNTQLKAVLGWEPSIDLKTGIAETYRWIECQYERRLRGEPGPT